MIKNDIREILDEISMKKRRHYADMLRDLGLHIGQDQLLCNLSKADGPTQTEISEQLNCEPPTIANMVKTLENYGFIHRERDERDGRVNRVYLSAEGKEMIDPIKHVWTKQQDVLVDGMSDDELQTLKHLLQKMADNLA